MRIAHFIASCIFFKNPFLQSALFYNLSFWFEKSYGLNSALCRNFICYAQTLFLKMKHIHPVSGPLPGYTPGRAAKFYIPLVIQAASQSLTYPLVASIVSHGANGAIDLAAFAQGQQMMFLLGAIGSGLLTTGMVFGHDASGFRVFKQLNLYMCLTLVILQLLLSGIPAAGKFIFHGILGLDHLMTETARNVMFWSTPAQICFFFRNAGLVPLYNARASAPANNATLCRIGLTACLSPLFVHAGWTGPFMGIVAMTGPVLLELLLTLWFARPYVKQLAASGEPHAGLRTQFMFTMPLSFGGILLSSAGIMVGAFIARAAAPAQMLPIHYVAMGIVNPVGLAALRMQAVTLAFPPKIKQDSSVFKFALASGVVLALFPLVGQIPCAAQWYFGKIQNLPAADIPLASQAMLLISILPVIQSLRGHAEGLAAWRRRPNAILAGQAINLAALVCTLFILLNFGLPGYLIGVIAILVATTMTLITIRLGLFWAEMEEKFGRTPAPREQN